MFHRSIPVICIGLSIVLMAMGCDMHSPRNLPQEVLEEVFEDVPEDVPQDAPQNLPQDVAEDVPQDAPQDLLQDVAEEVPEQPTWPAGAALAAKDIEEDGLTLTWPHAVDETVVAFYVVMRDGFDEATLADGKTTFQVSGLDEATTYTFSVMAEDAAGNRSPPLLLMVQTGDVTAPLWDEDASLTASQVTDTTLTLSWGDATDNVAVMTYEVHSDDTVVATTTGATHVDLTALLPWTVQSFEVIAVDGAGNASAPGPKVDVKTSDTVPPTWPGGAALTTSGVSAKAVTLNWPNATDNVGIASYQLRRDKVVVATTDSGTTTATVTGLDPSSNHTFTAWAVDMAGNASTGNPSTTLSTQDGGAPTWPEGTSIIASNVTSNTLTLGWTPAFDDVAVTAYRVLQDGVEVAVTAETTAAITGLGPWMAYTFTVVAEDGAGNVSGPGPSVSVKTPDITSPVWPEDGVLSVSAVGPYGLTLSWAGAIDDVSVVAYRVIQDGMMLATLGGEVTTFDVTGLSPWTDYIFRVGADDQAGNVSVVDLEAAVKTTDEVAPSWVAGELLASNVTNTTLKLTWPEANDDVGVTQYRVMLDGEELATVGDEVTSLEVVGLSPGTDYVFAVTATDAAGNWSMDGPSLSVKTMQIWGEYGDFSISVIRKRGDNQKEIIGNSVTLRPGDSIMFKAVVDVAIVMSIGFYSSEDVWTPIQENLELQPGEHFLEDAFFFKSFEDIGGKVAYGLADDVATALEVGVWDNVDWVDLLADSAVGSLTWDGFNVSKANIAQFGFLTEEPFDPITLAEDPALALGQHVCPWNHGYYWYPNAGEGSGMSWGDFDENLGWVLESEDESLKSGAVIHLKAHCKDEGCDEEQAAYLHSNSGKNGGNSWGGKNVQMAWKIVYDGALTSGAKVGLQANCLAETDNMACDAVKGLYLLSNAAESAGQSWGHINGNYAWVIEYAGDPTQPPATGQPVYLKGYCTGPLSQWLPPEAADKNSDCLSSLTADDVWNIHVDHGLVSGTPDNFKVEDAENWKGDLGRHGLRKYDWPIDGAFHVVKNDVSKCHTNPTPNMDKYWKGQDWVQSAKGLVESHVIEGDCVGDWTRGFLMGQIRTGNSASGLIASGDNHSCRLNDGGRIDCWGDNTKGQLNVPKGYFKAVEAGSNHSCALRMAGEAVCWGDGSKGQTAVTKGRFKNFSSNGDSVCALDFAGKAHCWGVIQGEVPDVVFAEVSTSGTHACGLDYKHKITCWGANDKGQIEAPGTEFDMLAVATGISCGIASADLGVQCWGDANLTVPLDQNMGNIAITTHADSICLVNRWHDATFDTYNPIFCWGSGKYINKHPLELVGENGADHLLGVGKNHACGMTQSGTMCWGDNSYHQADHVPIFSDFNIGGSHICALDEGKIQCRGDDSMGQLIPPPGPRVHGLVVGDNHSCGFSWQYLQTHSDIRCWGDGGKGQVNVPTSPESLKTGYWGAKSPLLSAGANHTCVLWRSGDPSKEQAFELDCWGDNELGQATAPKGKFSQVVSGTNHTCALAKDSKEAVCWGDNSMNQTSAPQGAFERLYAGGNVTCGIRPGNNNFSDLVCWGDESNGLTEIPSKPEGIPLEWWSTLNQWKNNGTGRPHLSLSATRACAIVKPGLPWAAWPEDMVTFQKAFIMCWGVKGVQTFGSTYGFKSVDVRNDVICATENGGGGYCWGNHPAQLMEIPEVVNQGKHTAAINKGLHAFRYPDNTGNTCGSCHAPDGIDLAYLHWHKDQSLKRRTEGHVPDEMVDDILTMLTAHREHYAWEPKIIGATFRPFQPQSDVLGGQTPVERDAAFAEALKALNLLLVTETIDTVEKAKAARDQLLALNLMELKIGFPLPQYSNDAFRGDKEKSIVEWIPAMAHRPAPGKKGELRDLENAYLANPNDGTFVNLLYAHYNTSDPVLIANPTFCGDMNINRCSTHPGKLDVGGNLDAIERQRMISLLILTHEMRRKMMGEGPRTTAQMAATYPVNPFWNWGALAEASGMACAAVRANLPKWKNNDDVKRECARIPEPWHGEYTDCTDTGRCFVTPDLLAMGLPLRWLGFMVQPALTHKVEDVNDPEPSSLTKVAVLGERLESAQLPSHHALMFITQRMHKFFGPDQSWKTAMNLINLEILGQEFNFMNAIGSPAGTTQEHAKTHALMLTNIQSILNLLAPSITL